MGLIYGMTLVNAKIEDVGVIMAARHYILLLMFLSSYFFLSPNLGGLWADHHQTLPHVRW